jgi:multiple antibiotic resistance protein
MPMLAGPGAISTIMVLSGQASTMAQKIAVFLSIAVTMAIAWIVLRIGDKVVARMGVTGIRVMTRIMGLLLAAIAMQFVISGASEAWHAAVL